MNEEIENPIIWPLLTMIKSSEQSLKVHELASSLTSQGLLPDLDNDPNRSLFKRNFLLMNALYQLQDLLLPDLWLQVQSMDIRLSTQPPSDLSLILKNDLALRSYYLDWENFETSSENIEALFTSFWTLYEHYIGKADSMIDRISALKIFELDSNASAQDVRRRWRKLALKYHPDRATGDAAKFRELCEAWQQLRS